MKNKKLPPFGALLSERQKFKNPPWLVVVCVGAGAWAPAKARKVRGDSVGLVLPPGENPSAFTWPVNGCRVVVEWNTGPGVELVVELARELLRAGAKTVTIWPRWVDYSNPHLGWPAKQPPIRTYRANRSHEVTHATR
jgi:hypothetical protein